MQSQYQTAITAARKDKFLRTITGKARVESVRMWPFMHRWSTAGKIAGILWFADVPVTAEYPDSLKTLIPFSANNLQDLNVSRKSSNHIYLL